MVKRISVMMLALCLMLNVNALAVSPRADSTMNCTPNLVFRGNTANCSLRHHRRDLPHGVFCAGGWE